MLSKFLKDKKHKVKDILKEGLKLGSYGSTAYVFIAVMNGWNGQDNFENPIAFINYHLSEMGVSEILFELFDLFFISVGIAFVVVTYKLTTGFLHYRKSMKLFYGEKGRAILEHGFENHEDEYLIGSFDDFTVRMQVKPDKEYFNSCMFVGFAKERDELVIPETEILMFYDGNFVEIVLESDGEDEREVLKTIDADKIPNSNHAIIFFEVLAGHDKGFATENKMFKRLDRLTNTMQNLEYKPLIPIEISGLKLHEYLESINLKHFIAS